MIFEITIQVRVANYPEGLEWYRMLMNREPDFIPHEGFAEWELIPGCWLQIAEGEPAPGSGPIRLGVQDIERERDRLAQHLMTESFTIHTRDEVPVKWGTFTDPWGNRIGLFEYLNKDEERERIRTIISK
ncbi:VOC family protein [Paenibacillus ihbetae]|uniref:Ornithine monooxygenase n=1 Tax=Paenibacillus ihbetae TaxID=1870820 RepID=A0ABX3JWT9_9BACL|nr:VOC family protein [Paenibacillus ihbetae]OOC61230.1 ornithine monooxygenase [Paenibacillus ihbetae]